MPTGTENNPINQPKPMNVKMTAAIVPHIAEKVFVTSIPGIPRRIRDCQIHA